MDDDMAKRKKRAAGEGTIRKHASGSWGARLTVPGRKSPKSFYGKTQAEVLEKREEAKQALLTGIDFDTGTQTLTDYLHSWLEDTVRVSLRRPTYEGYERMVRNHITPTLGDIRLKDLKALHIQTLYATKFDAGYALRTRRYIHTTLNKALKQAVRWNQIAMNPAADVEVPKADVEVLDLEDLPDPDMQTLAEDQVRLFLDFFCQGLTDPNERCPVGRGECLRSGFSFFDDVVDRLNSGSPIYNVPQLQVRRPVVRILRHTWPDEQFPFVEGLEGLPNLAIEVSNSNVLDWVRSDSL
jgi:hypothetical protein